MPFIKKFFSAIIQKLGSKLGSRIATRVSANRTATSIWKLGADTSRVHCFITNTQSIQEERVQTPLFNREDSIAQGLVVSELEQLFSNKLESFYHISPLLFRNTPELLENVILIGGSANNSISEELLSNTVCHNLNISFDLTNENRDLSYLNSNSVRKTLHPTQQSPGIFCDYGVILNIRNPWSDSHRLIAIMGCNGLGTIGCAKYIKSGRMIKELKKEIKKVDEYAVIIHCSGLWTNEELRLNTSDIHLEEFIPLKTWHQ